jgi:hypothetical protein
MCVEYKRSSKTKKWDIPDKFINSDFADFLLNVNDLDRDMIPITGGGSLQEWADHYQLWESHGIDLDAIVKLLDDKGCGKINKKENHFQYHHQNITYLEMEIRARIKD